MNINYIFNTFNKLVLIYFVFFVPLFIQGKHKMIKCHFIDENIVVFTSDRLSLNIVAEQTKYNFFKFINQE